MRNADREQPEQRFDLLRGDAGHRLRPEGQAEFPQSPQSHGYVVVGGPLAAPTANFQVSPIGGRRNSKPATDSLTRLPRLLLPKRQSRYRAGARMRLIVPKHLQAVHTPIPSRVRMTQADCATLLEPLRPNDDCPGPAFLWVSAGPTGLGTTASSGCGSDASISAAPWLQSAGCVRASR